jgi:hypothetical protein
MSNPRGGYTKSKLKQNQDIRDTVEAHIAKKGRSKSRRSGPATSTAIGFHGVNYPNQSLMNTKTIEEYSSGLIDAPYNRHHTPAGNLFMNYASTNLAPNIIISQLQ